jgi:putative transposase
VHELRQQHALSVLLAVAGLARSTFYYQHKALGQSDRHAEVKAAIRSVYDHHQGRYGYRRITAALRQQGQAINAKRVQRLMGLMGLQSRVRPKKYRAYRGEVGPIAPDRLQRVFKAARPNQKWVTDVTEFKVGNEKLYLSPVMDLFSREIVAYELDRRPCFGMVSRMLASAVAQRGTPAALLLHSDQGWQYQMKAFRRQLDEEGISQSMSRKGNCLDNAAMESFFATLKTECFYLKRFTSLDELEQELVEYIHYYNPERISLKLKGLSPVQYRTQPFSH